MAIRTSYIKTTRSDKTNTFEGHVYFKAGQKVKVVIYGTGHYGRTLALIYLPDGTCYNERIVQDGYSCVYKYRGHKSKELPQDEWVRLNQLLEEARKNHVGLWRKYYNVMECLCR